MMSDRVQLRLMTYNIGGGRKDFGSNLDKIQTVIKTFAPDVLAIQEASDWQDMDGNLYEPSATIADSLDYRYFYFGPTLSMREQFHVNKPLFVDWIFNDRKDWRQGNALVTRWPFVRLKDTSQLGEPWNIPLYHTLQYEGYRDTEPRFVILARINLGSVQPFILTTHFTTLLGERGGERREIPGKTTEAQKIRWEQSCRLIDLIQTHLLDTDKVIFLMGDFNAIETEPCISSALKQRGKFVVLSPEKKTQTHLKIQEPVDHILIYPGNTRIEYKCWVVNNGFDASDHNPVVADLIVYDSDSMCFQDFGPGVVRMEQ